MHNSPIYRTEAAIPRSETTARCMSAEKLNNSNLNAAARSLLLTHVESQSGPTSGRRPLKPSRFLEHAIAQPRQPRQREPPNSWTHEPHWSADQRQHADTPVGLSELPCSDTRRHWLLKGKTYLTMAEETQAQVNHMVGNCSFEPPHKRKRASNELYPLTERHIMKTNDRQSSRTLAHGPRNNDHTRTCRKTRIDSETNSVELGSRCAALMPRTHTTPHTSCASCPSANSMFHSHRKGVLPQHIRTVQSKGNMQYDRKNTKIANTLEQTTNKPQSATTAPCPCDANSYNHGTNTNCLSQYGASYVLGHNLTHRALWTHGGQMSAHNGPRITTRIYNTTCPTRKRPTRE